MGGSTHSYSCAAGVPHHRRSCSRWRRRTGGSGSDTSCRPPADTCATPTTSLLRRKSASTQDPGSEINAFFKFASWRPTLRRRLTQVGLQKLKRKCVTFSLDLRLPDTTICKLAFSTCCFAIETPSLARQNRSNVAGNLLSDWSQPIILHLNVWFDRS